MTAEERNIQTDRMNYTKDSLSSALVLIAIVSDALYFVSIYKTDVGSYYYTWQIGASIIYNLVFLLAAFLCSEGVKSRKKGYWAALIGLGLMQIVRIFYMPAKARAAIVTISGVDSVVMGDSQYAFVVACLAVSAACCLIASVISFRNNRRLALYMRQVQNQSA